MSEETVQIEGLLFAYGRYDVLPVFPLKGRGLLSDQSTGWVVDANGSCWLSYGAPFTVTTRDLLASWGDPRVDMALGIETDWMSKARAAGWRPPA